MARYTIAQAARDNGLKLFDVLRAVQQGQLSSLIEDSTVYITPEALDRYIAMQQERNSKEKSVQHPNLALPPEKTLELVLATGLGVG